KRLHGDFLKVDFDAQARGHEGAVGLPGVKNAAAHGPATNHPDLDLSHKSLSACNETPHPTNPFSSAEASRYRTEFFLSRDGRGHGDSLFRRRPCQAR